MTENECNLLKYYERTVKECMEECDGICIMYNKGNCECVDANVLDHLRELQQYRAIGTVESLKNLPAICDSLSESSEKAEKLIEELKAYRAIGTVEEIQSMKDQLLMVKDMCKDYYAIGTIEEFKALKEKAEPKELAEHNFQDEVHYYLCPSCRSIVSCTQNYCDECGQALET